MAGGDWPRIARIALVKLCTQTQPVVSTGVQLLAAIREIFDVAVAEKLTTRHALEELAARDEGPWAFMFEDALKHDKLNSAGAKLARMLSKYKTPDGEPIKPRPMRLADGSVSKGYYKDDFKAAWERYLPFLSLSIPQNVVTEVTAVTHEGKSVTTGSFCNVTERLQEPEPLHFYLAL